MSKLIFGHTWEAIQRAQQGGNLHEKVIGPSSKPLATEKDWGMFEMLGQSGLEQLEYWGVIDRLKNSLELSKKGE